LKEYLENTARILGFSRNVKNGILGAKRITWRKI
jgi:hypothetical protein